MSRLQAAAALQVGIGLAVELGERTDILAAGEMGIGNTTAAAALCAVFTGLPPRDLAGAGTGLDRGGIAHKADVIEAALAVHRPDPHDPLGVLAAVGGFEIAAMAGFMLGGASRRRPVIVDGFISLAAALVAIAFRPGVREYLCLSHLSAERGHGLVCAHLKLDPLLDLGMRLGEGTGAVLAAHLLRTAVAAQDSMATFATAGIPGRTQPA
jgi:nicotinate-nucleotide--dimethylbenzimidazole phosphoribosyltransferase